MSLDDARRLALKFRDRLFQAIDEGDFEGIPALGREYCDQVRRAVQNCSVTEASDLEPLLGASLVEGIRYLRTRRAHQSTAFRKLAQDKVYAQNTEAANSPSTLHLNA